jgi:circadian clock protein KaiC
MNAAGTDINRTSTGVEGLDYVLRGGLPKERIHLVYGGPGTGKTTLSFQFLLEGARRGEKSVYLALCQTRKELEDVCRSHAWPIDAVTIAELPRDVQEASSAEQTVFSTGDVELSETTDAILRVIDEHKPDRFVLDSVSELAVRVDTSYQFRRQIIRLIRELARRECSAIFTYGEYQGADLLAVQTLVHGVITLEQNVVEYGHAGRSLQVTKMRGIDFVAGKHDFSIRTGGLEVFPRLQMRTDGQRIPWKVITSGNRELDTMVGGGLEEGTSCLVCGSAGAGKSTLGALYVAAAAANGQRSAYFCFDERRDTFLRRLEALDIGVQYFEDEQMIDLHQMNIGEISPGEFFQTVRRSVDSGGCRIVVIDSLTGYLSSFPQDRGFMSKLHEMLSYLSSKGVLTILIVATHDLSSSPALLDASYLADTVIVMRHFEAFGVIRRCISVVKKRHGPHEGTIREVQIGRGGIRVGKPLVEFSGLLTGRPVYEGSRDRLMNHIGVKE